MSQANIVKESHCVLQDLESVPTADVFTVMYSDGLLVTYKGPIRDPITYRSVMNNEIFPVYVKKFFDRIYGDKGVDRFHLGRYNPEYDLPPTRGARVRKPFVKYNDSVPMSDLLLDYDASQYSFFDIVKAGWPPHLANRILKSPSNNKILRYLKKPKEDPEAKLHHRQVIAVRESRHHKGANATLWRVPTFPASPAPKPVTYNRRRFMEWVAGVTWALQVSLDNQINTNSQHRRKFVSGNMAAQVLYYYKGNASPHELQHLLSKAVFYLETYAPSVQHKFGLLPFTTWMQIDEKFLIVLDNRVDNIDQLNLISFGRDENIRKKCVKYFEGDESIDKDLLQTTLNKMSSRVASTKGKETRKSTIKVHLQGAAHSINIKHTHQVSLETMESSQSILAFTALLTGVIYAENWQSFVSIITMYISSSKFLMSVFASLAAQLALPQLFCQGGVSDFISSISESIMNPVVALLVFCGVDALLKEVSEGVRSLIMPIVKELTAAFRVSIIKESATTLAKMILDWVGDIFNRIKDCIESKSLEPIWGDRWNPKIWLRDSEGLVAYYVLLTVSSSSSPSVNADILKLVKQGLLPAKWIAPVPIEQFIQCVTEHIDNGNELLVYFKSKPKIVATIERGLSKLSDFCRKITLNNCGVNERICPLGIYFYGAPGVGKTTICKQLIMAINATNGQDDSHSSTYYWQTNANFQDGLNQLHRYIVMDDVDQSVAPPSAGTPNHVEQVISLINNKPFPVEQADVTFKGKVFANPLMVLYLSNLKNGRAQELTHSPVAFYRRWKYHVTVVVKAEFLKEGSKTLLCEEKAKMAGTHDMWDLQVSVYEGQADFTRFLSNPVTYTFPAFMKLLQVQYKEHIANQFSFISSRAGSPSICPVCGLSSMYICGCVETLQGNVPTKKVDFFEGLEEEESDDDSEGPEIYHRKYGKVEFRDKFPSLSLIKDALKQKKTEAGEALNNATKDLGQSGDKLFSSIFESYGFSCHFQKDLAEFIKPIADMAPTMLAIFGMYNVIKIVIMKAVQVVEQGRIGNGTNVDVVSNWVRPDQTFVPGVPGFGSSTFTYQDIARAIQESHCEVTVGATSMHASMLGQGLLLVPSHLFKDRSATFFIIEQGGTTLKLNITDLRIAVVPRDDELCVVSCSKFRSSIGIAKKMWTHLDESVQTFDEVHLFGRDLEQDVKTNKIVAKGGKKFLQSSAVTINGDCGKIYVARHNSSWKVVGMHYAMHETTSIMGTIKCAVASLITSSEITRIAATLGYGVHDVVVIPQCITQSGENVVLSPFSPQSEVWASLANNESLQIFPFGRMEHPLPGSSMKTKVKNSLLHDYLQDYEEKYCGCKDYWTTPKFRGKMEGVSWKSPYTNAFETHNTTTPDHDLMMLAIADYLDGVGTLDISGYAELSKEEVLTGVKGSNINGVNMKTSVGPPYNVSKQRHIVINKVSGSEISPEVTRSIDSLEEVLENGDVPSVLGMWTLKDEPVKTSEKILFDGQSVRIPKNPRVFICLPFAFNYCAKKYGASWRMFMRSNFTFFECAVGINMTSAESNKLVSFLKEVSPNLDQIYDGDVRALDKSYSFALIEYVAYVAYALSFAIGVEPWKNYRMMLSMKEVLHYLKGDLFRCPMNCSGWDATVEMNSILMSISERYVYYKQNGFQGDMGQVRIWFSNFFEMPLHEMEGFTFRRNVSLITYGDDSLKAMRIPPSANYLDIWKDELGMEVTPADKSSSKTLHPSLLTETQFLKRQFVWDEDLQLWVPRLDMKSIVRMLTMQKDSVLTARDHTCVTVSEALKECVYHGRETYMELYDLVVPELQRMELISNPNLELQSYEFWREKIREGNFQTWSLRETRPPEVVNPENVYYQMSQSNTDEGHNSDPAVSTESNSQQYDAGSIITKATNFLYPTNKSSNFQSMPTNKLDDFFVRPTKIATWSVDSLDVAGTVVASINPWQLWLNDTAVNEKLKNFSYIRGTIQVIGVVTMPGAGYGCYAVTALPNVLDVLGIAGYNPNNMLQTDYFTQVDCSAADNFVFQLPFIWKFDFATIDSSLGVNPDFMWKLLLTTIQPIGTSVAGGIVQGNITLYASLLEDYELVVPRFQGKNNSIKGNAALKQLAPALLPSEYLTAASNIALAASVIPQIAPFAIAGSVAAKAGSQILSMFGFTRDTVEKAPLATTQRSITNVAHVDCSDPSESASLAFVNEISIDPSLSGFNDSDCLANADFFDRWTFIGRFPWLTSNAALDDLAIIPISPSYCVASSITELSMTTAGYYGLPFEYWRGDMVYKLITPVSKLHRGALQIIWVPIGSAPGSDATNTSMNVVFDVAAGEDFEFTVGFAREVPYCHNRIITDDLPIVPIGTTNGWFVIRVVNPLVAQTATANTSISIFAKAKNMDFSVPRDTMLFMDADLNPITYDIVTQVILQGKTLGDEVDTKVAIELVPKTAAFPGDKLYFGESVESIRALLQKPSKLNTVDTGISALTRYPIMGQPPAIVNPGAQLPLWSWNGYYSAPFLGLSSSERFKVIPNGDMYVGAFREVLSGAAPAILQVGTLAPMTFTGANRGAEFIIPYYYPEKFQLMREQRSEISFSTTAVNSIVVRGGVVGSKIVVYHSLGPDIRATCFRMLPIVNFKLTIDPLYQVWF